MSSATFTLPWGMKDIEPVEMAKRKWIQDRTLDILQRYSFKLVEPSAIESLETLEAKCGPGIREEIYWFKDKAGRSQGLRFDLTVGLARMVAAHQEWPLPLKLCAFSNMWRYDEPQHGRYRCFHQWDAEIFGTEDVTADAEIMALSLDVLKALGLEQTVLRMSSRRLTEGFLESLDVPPGDKREAALRVIDKLRKQPPEELKEELVTIGLSVDTARRVLEFASVSGKPSDTIPKVQRELSGNKTAEKGLGELASASEALESFGCSDRCIIDLSIVRGLGYYDGIVFEVYDEASPDLGALVGGGRFDALSKTYGRDLPATGVAGGVERLLLALEKAEKLPKTPQAPTIFVVAVDDSERPSAWKIARTLREEGLAVDFDLKKRSLRRQLEYADSIGASYALIVGPRELHSGNFTLRDMTKRSEEEVRLAEIPQRIAGKRKSKKTFN
ncbi:MAG: histidine--tRNA ligase [Candidatus Bathyarchaeia archaeon]